jgi:hypothetical protein
MCQPTKIWLKTAAIGKVGCKLFRVAIQQSLADAIAAKFF